MSIRDEIFGIVERLRGPRPLEINGQVVGEPDSRMAYESPYAIDISSQMQPGGRWLTQDNERLLIFGMLFILALAIVFRK